MKFSGKHTGLLALALTSVLLAPVTSADSDHRQQNPMPCPVAPYDGVTPMDVEFGYGAQDVTHCLQVRHHARVVVGVNRPFTSNAFGAIQKTKAVFLSNLDHLVRNYENVHGMTIGKDVEVAVILMESGAVLGTSQHAVFATANGVATNPFAQLVEQAQQKGIKFYMCQTAARNLGITLANMLPGIEFVPGGQIAIADFQMRGYALILP